MSAISETSLNNISPETIETYHDLTIMWMKANIDISKLSPEELYFEFKKTYDKISDADTLTQKGHGILP